MDSYFFSEALLPQGWAQNVRIETRQGLITSVVSASRPESGDQCHQAGIPMMPNCHSHVFQRAMAGRAEYRASAQDDFWSWRQQMYHLANRMNTDQLHQVATACFREMRLAGYSHVCEFHYVHRALDNPADTCANSEALLAAASDAGIGITLLPVLYSYAGLNQQPLQQEQQRFGMSVKEYLHLYEHLDGRLGPEQQLGICFHSMRAVGSSQMLEVLEAVDQPVPIHIHIAEQQAEVAQVCEHLGQRPIEWLLAHFPVDRNWCLVHATHVNPVELKALADSGAVAGLCPITEANLGDGVFPLEAYVQAGGMLAIGSDSNIEINPAAELKMLEYSQRLQLQRRNVSCHADQPHTGTFLWQQAVAGGAQASGLTCAGIRVGARADVMALQLPAAEDFVSGAEALDRWIFSDQIRHVCLPRA